MDFSVPISHSDQILLSWPETFCQHALNMFITKKLIYWLWPSTRGSPQDILKASQLGIKPTKCWNFNHCFRSHHQFFYWSLQMINCFIIYVRWTNKQLYALNIPIVVLVCCLILAIGHRFYSTSFFKRTLQFLVELYISFYSGWKT